MGKIFRDMRALLALLALCLGVVSGLTVEEELWMDSSEIPNPGPQDQATKYIAGEPGGVWTSEEVEITRRRIRMLITPDWSVKQAMGVAATTLGKNKDDSTPPTENLLMRLAFHDCIPYKGGKIDKGEGKGKSADGCDGCLNWKGMDWERMKPDDETKRFAYPADNFTTTSNQGPWAEHQDDATERRNRHAQSWNNEFAFPWEVGMYWNLTDVDPLTGAPTPGRRPMGCQGLDAPYDTWPYRNNIKPNYASPAMNCGVNDYAPEGRELHEIIDDLALD